MFKNFTLKNYRSRLKAAGFSMLEAVVVVGVLLALAVGGFIAYGAVVENAKRSSVAAATMDVYTAVQVAELDGDPTTTPLGVINEFNDSQDKVTVVIDGYNG